MKRKPGKQKNKLKFNEHTNPGHFKFLPALRNRIHVIIYESDTFAGKLFDLLLLWSIILSLIIVMLDSVSSITAVHGDLLKAFEWLFTGLFTIEYLLRLFSVGRPLRYATSFFGLIDLFSILPTYLTIFIDGGQYLMTIRAMRLLRIFRILKLARYIEAAQFLTRALQSAKHKITVFLSAVLGIVIVMGTIMYQIEGPENGFTSIPKGIYWAIVTLTTVGYGDIAPKTVPGQLISSLVMVLGYAIIAIPTGIVTAELSGHKKGKFSNVACPQCSLEGHDNDAVYCKYCGAHL